MRSEFDRAWRHIDNKEFVFASEIIESLLKTEDCPAEVWYWAGQCLRYVGDIEGAIVRLKKAASMEGSNKQIFLALGIAFQLNEEWEGAIESFRIALTIDQDYVAAYNGLALTQKKMGDLDKSLHNYWAGAQTLVRSVVFNLNNVRSSRVIKHRDVAGQIWIELVSEVSVLICSRDNIQEVSWLSGVDAVREEENEFHEGLYWKDIENSATQTTRCFLPNFYNTVREALQSTNVYSNLIGNRGVVLEGLGRKSEAEAHFAEAEEFQPRAE
jgi:tetratricopeptide (TPR) repeat protein